MNNQTLIECKNISKYYQMNNIHIEVLNNINLSLKYGEMVSITGNSGSGKSTLLHILAGLDQPNKGNVIFEGKILNKLNKKDLSSILNLRLGFIYQFHHLLTDFNAWENVAIPLMINGTNISKAKNLAQQMLKKIGLEDKMHHKTHELSGGERQRISVARAIINKPALVLADEPTGNLDAINANNLITLLNNFNKYYGTTFLIVTHDMNLAKKMHKRIKIENSKLYIENIKNK